MAATVGSAEATIDTVTRNRTPPLGARLRPASDQGSYLF
jgi:hypothetical protein